jgi:flagellar biosynthesis GTPase FlhF
MHKNVYLLKISQSSALLKHNITSILFALCLRHTYKYQNRCAKGTTVRVNFLYYNIQNHTMKILNSYRMKNKRYNKRSRKTYKNNRFIKKGGHAEQANNHLQDPIEDRQKREEEDRKKREEEDRQKREEEDRKKREEEDRKKREEEDRKKREEDRKKSEEDRKKREKEEEKRKLLHEIEWIWIRDMKAKLTKLEEQYVKNVDDLKKPLNAVEWTASNEYKRIQLAEKIRQDHIILRNKHETELKKITDKISHYQYVLRNPDLDWTIKDFTKDL